jgi:hypothetical protein
VPRRRILRGGANGGNGVLRRTGRIHAGRAVGPRPSGNVSVPDDVFTKNLYDVDFFVSRAALYAILLGIVVAVIALTESFLDHDVLGRFGNIVVSFAIPIVLGLSMSWIGGRRARSRQRRRRSGAGAEGERR